MKAGLIFILLIVVSLSQKVMAQCAMCKTTIVNNVSNGELALAEGLNFGIMYLFITPYLAIVTIALIWFIKSRKHGLRSSNPIL